VRVKVVGIVVLAMSMAFLYVYIKHVYLVRVVGGAQSEVRCQRITAAYEELVPVEDHSKKSVNRSCTK
jgi:hypothetical protein